MLTASTPGAPPLAWTFFHASNTRRLGISNDFTFCFGPPLGSSPAGLASGRPGLPDPFTPAPLQDLHRYYGPVRPRASHRYSAAPGAHRLRSSLSTTKATPWPSVSRRQVLLFHASACDELTPPIHRAPPGQHTGRLLAQGTPTRARLHPGDT